MLYLDLTQSKYINKTETKQKQRPTTRGTLYGSSFVTFYNITRGLVNTIRQSLINWSLWRGNFGSLGRALVAVTIVERWPL